MSCKHARARKLAILCLAFTAPALAAQVPYVSAPDTYGPPRYAQMKLPGGAVQFTDQEIGLSFTLPGDWGFGNQGLRFMDWGWRGNGEGDIATTVLLHRRHTDEDVWLYYCIFRHIYPATPDQMDKRLDEEADDKISQRRMGEKLKGYRVRPSSYERREIGGHRALSWVADFLQGKSRMVEYEVVVQSDRHLAEFHIRCPASELDAVRKDVEPIVQSVRMQ